MKSNRSSPIWPYLAVLACLFAVCVLAPRGWQRLARNESVDVFLQDNQPKLSGRLRWNQRPAKPAPALVADDQQQRDQQQHSELDTIERAPANAAASNSPARIVTTSQAVDSPSEPQPNELEHDIASANRPARQTDSEGGAPRPVKNPWSLFRTAATRTVPTRTAPARDAAQPPKPISVAERLPTPTAEASDEPETTHRAPAVALQEASAGSTETIRFPRPEPLLAELTAISHEPRASEWAATVARLLGEVCDDPASTSRPTTVALDDLRLVAQQGEALAASIPDPRLASQVLRAQYALSRRVDIWQRIASLSARSPVEASESTPERMPVALEAVESLTRAQREGTAWREYLQLPRLRHLIGRDNNSSPDERRKIAKSVLARLSNVRLSRDQKRFVDDRALADFRSELQHWAAEPVDKQELLVDLERYERTGTALDAHRLASNCRWLCWSGDAESQQLGSQLEEHYRNANVRLAVSQSFLSRFLPQPGTIVAPVRDTIAGAQVEGQSTTYTKLALLMIPDPNKLRLGIEAHGNVQSNTAATSGPATFHSSGESQFVARKLLLFGPRGLNVFPAMSAAESTRQQLVAMETDFDRVPLLDSVVRNIARSEYDATQDAARSEVEQKIAARARTQFDSEIEPKLAQAVQKFNDRVRSPLDRLGLEPQLLAASTSEDRAVLRLRLAGQEQLAAFTPRPRAPSDSLVSLQVHQSALNNALERLELDGRTFTLPELFEHLGQKMGKQQVELPEDLPKNVSVTFAAHDAVRLNCDNGQIEVRISIADLSERRKHWKNFVVRTHYRPDTSSLETRFVRSGGIFLEGESLKGKAQFALRSVFSKVLSPSRHWGLIEPKLAADPRMSDVEITQFDVDKGWIGIAYAARRQPQPVAGRVK